MVFMLKFISLVVDCLASCEIQQPKNQFCLLNCKQLIKFDWNKNVGKQVLRQWKKKHIQAFIIYWAILNFRVTLIWIAPYHQLMGCTHRVFFWLSTARVKCSMMNEKQIRHKKSQLPMWMGEYEFHSMRCAKNVDKKRVPVSKSLNGGQMQTSCIYPTIFVLIEMNSNKVD